MSKRNIYLFRILFVIIFFTSMLSCSSEKNEDFTETVKISLREVGHQILLSSGDSTSLVLPVIALDNTKYRLEFQQQIFINPDSLISIVKGSLKKSALPKNYRVEVKQCTDQEVAYSYEVKNKQENSIIPCRGRFLPINCYTIELKFTDKTTSFFERHSLLLSLIFMAFVVLAFVFYKQKRGVISVDNNEKHAAIGSFQFYPEQNKLIKEAIEISLSKKECELLEIFVANPNQIIKRDELEKRVWEDQGVFVGRSLDTYISKLRKKLKLDDSIKLTNVHGIGYKLETNL